MELIQKISAKTGLSVEDVQKKVLDKQRELSGLVSLEGATYIVAKELGIDLVEQTHKRLEIKNVIPGIRNLNLTGRIIRIFPAKEFEREGKKSKVASIVLADTSGDIRLSLWDDQTQHIESLKLGQAVEIFGGYTREDGRGSVEIRLTKRGGIKLLESSVLPKIEELQKKDTAQSLMLQDVKEGGQYRIRAALLQVFETNAFYEICPQCGSRIKAPDFKCPEHGPVKPDYAMVLSGVIDDGSWNMRAVFFRDMAERILGMKTIDALRDKEHIFEKAESVLGTEFIFIGRVRRNQMFDRLEFIVSDVKHVVIEEEINKLINSLASNA